MNPEKIDEIADVIVAALDELAQICSQADAGLALGVAGLRELHEVTDDEAALMAYREIANLLKAELALRLPAKH